MDQILWFDRKFNFGEDNIFPSILERLWGSPILYRKKCELIPATILQKKESDQWSILENIGHIIDLEPLWQRRLLDIKQGKQYLREADLSNTKTHNANHNQRNLDDLLDEFSNLRNQTLNQLKELTEKEIFMSAKHPRLHVPMRTMDLFLFVAEHDDHHLATISKIAKKSA